MHGSTLEFVGWDGERSFVTSSATITYGIPFPAGVGAVDRDEDAGGRRDGHDALHVARAGRGPRAELRRAERRPPESLEAWGLYQRALPLACAFTREDCARARALLERAVALDPRLSTALARLAEVGVWEVLYEWTDAPSPSPFMPITGTSRGTLPKRASQGRVVKPTLSLALARRCLGRMAPDVDRRFTEALHQSGLE